MPPASNHHPKNKILLSVPNMSLKGLPFNVPLRLTLCLKTLSEHAFWKCLGRRDGAVQRKSLAKDFRAFQKCMRTFFNPICSPRFRVSASGNVPACCLRFWRSPRYQRISPLHLEFRTPLTSSKPCRFPRGPPVKPKNFTED